MRVSGRVLPFETRAPEVSVCLDVLKATPMSQTYHVIGGAVARGPGSAGEVGGDGADDALSNAGGRVKILGVDVRRREVAVRRKYAVSTDGRRRQRAPNVASHITHIPSKLGVSSPSQIATCVVQHATN